MERITLYEYDRRNMRKIETEIKNNTNSQIVLLHFSSIINKLINKEDSITFSKDNFYDLTPILISEGSRSEFWAQRIIEIINGYFEYVEFPVYFIIDKRYVSDVLESLYHYIDGSESLENLLG